MVDVSALGGTAERRMITLDGAGMRFTFRAAGVAVQDGQVLLQCAPDEGGFWGLPGGRVEMGESAAATLLREMQEELGVTVEVGRLLWTVENFFEYEGHRHHELGLYLAMTIPPERGPLHGPFVAMEGEQQIPCVWHPLEDVAQLPIYPTFLREALTDLPDTPVHLVHVDPPKT